MHPDPSIAIVLAVHTLLFALECIVLICVPFVVGCCIFLIDHLFTKITKK